MAEINNNIKILIVDDVEANRFVLRNIITDMGYMPILAESGPQALKVVSMMKPSIILLDISMPGMDGYEVCSELKSNAETRDIPVIFISAFDENDDIVKGFNVGGEDYIIKPFVKEVVQRRIDVRLTLAEANDKLASMNHQLVTLVNQQSNQIEEEKKMVLYALANVAKENANYEEGYMDRIQSNCSTLAQAMQLSPNYETRISDNFIDAISLAAPLCDLGNVGVPVRVLQKDGTLNEEETKLMQEHTTIGARILEDIKRDGYYNEFIDTAIDICKYHHENYDGSGYPMKLAENRIPIAAQIVRVANVYTALTERRNYREAYSPEDALVEMDKGTGIEFNPDILDIAKKIYKQFI